MTANIVNATCGFKSENVYCIYSDSDNRHLIGVIHQIENN